MRTRILQVAVVVFMLAIGSLAGEEYLPDANTVALWHFNEGTGTVTHNATNSSGEYDAALEGTTWTSGYFSSAVQFGASSSVSAYVDFPDNSQLANVTLGDFTIEAMVKLDAVPNDIVCIVDFLGTSDQQGLRIYTGGYPQLKMSADPTGVVTSQVALETGRWYHIAGTSENEILKIYVDAVEQGSATSSNQNYNNIFLRIGNISAGGRQVHHVPGIIDEVRISNVARRADEFLRNSTNLPPVADFVGSPISGNSPLPVTFSDRLTGTIADWQWDFGDGETSSETNPSHTYVNPGTYTVSLTVSGPNGSDNKTRIDFITVHGAGAGISYFNDFSSSDLSDWEFYKWSSGLHGPVQDPYVQDGRLYITTRDQQSTWLMNGENNWVDYTLEADARIEQSLDDGYKGIYTLVYASNIHYGSVGYPVADCYFLNLGGRDGVWYLVRRYSNGDDITLASGAINLSVGVEYHEKIVVHGNQIQVYFNPLGGTETLLTEVTVASNMLAGGKFGFTGSDDLISIDNVSVIGNGTVVDTTPPTISVALSPNQIWPPNHKLVTVQAAVTVSDDCDPAPAVVLTSIESNEPDNGLGDGDKPDDIQGEELGTSDYVFRLRAERSGSGNGRVYTVTYRATDASGNSSIASATVIVPHNMQKSVALLETLPMPDEYALFQNYPNPFNPETEISYQLPNTSNVTLKIYNAAGQEIRSLVDEERQAGSYTIRWDGRDQSGAQVSSGLYFYTLKAGEFSETRRALFMR